MTKSVWFVVAVFVWAACAGLKTPLATQNVPSQPQVKISQNGLLPADDPDITITGAFFLKKSAQRVILNRFTETVLHNDSTFLLPEKARTQSGVCIFLATDSKTVTFKFEKRDSSWYRSSKFAVFADGRLLAEVPVRANTPVDSFTVTRPDSLKTDLTVWQVSLPHFYGLNFSGLRIEKGSRYCKVEPPQKVYVAIGNSITHGTGQQGTHQTYPFLLARIKNWSLYNLAVGGSRTSWPVATLLRGQKVEVITVLWGYNDWNAGFTLEQEKTYYRRLVQELLKAQPKARIYCITPTFTYRTQPKKGSLTLDQIREAQAEVVKSLQQNGFENLFLIRGEQITDGSFLKPQGEKDVVHFTVQGAAKFAQELAQILQ